MRRPDKEAAPRRRSPAYSSRGSGQVYLIHFDQRYKHAGHYCGWTNDLDARLAEHAAGRGARLMNVIKDAGITWRMARTWDGTRTRERQIKTQGGLSRCCPECGVTPRTAQPEPQAPAPQSPRPSAAAAEVPAYDFRDWPALTAGLTAAETAELTRQLEDGRWAAYQAATEAATEGLGADWAARFDTATDVDLAWQAVIRQAQQPEQAGRQPAPCPKEAPMSVQPTGGQMTSDSSVKFIEPTREEHRALIRELDAGKDAAEGAAREVTGSPEYGSARAMAAELADLAEEERWADRCPDPYDDPKYLDYEREREAGS